ncbi:hypothetical protein HAP54_000012760 [Bradyrhizobium sp. 2S1]
MRRSPAADRSPHLSLTICLCWSRTTSAQIRKQLNTVITPTSKLTKPVKKPKATWVEPKFYDDVEYRDVTSEGLLRASSFKRL